MYVGPRLLISRRRLVGVKGAGVEERERGLHVEVGGVCVGGRGTRKAALATVKPPHLWERERIREFRSRRPTAAITDAVAPSDGQETGGER